ncbi:hypothetical protein JL721_2309 [Aureococcus anophagefferens]|nr:hypothetical protein JL721_2309 [Aureococcus anophagefferens]
MSTKTLTPAELARREKQKAAQAAAKLRQAAGAPTKKERKKRKRDVAAGVAPEPKKPNNSGAKASSGGGAAWRKREFAGKGRNEFKRKREAEDELAAEAAGRTVHDVVIVPIFWRTRPGEEDAVVGEAERIKRLIAKVGDTKVKLDVWVDRTHKSPGQKLQFWEAVGVKWRVELGPDDVRAARRELRGGSGYESNIKLGMDKIPDDVEENPELGEPRGDKRVKWNALPTRRASRRRGKPPKLKIGVTPPNKKTTFGDDDPTIQYAAGGDGADSDSDSDRQRREEEEAGASSRAGGRVLAASERLNG